MISRTEADPAPRCPTTAFPHPLVNIKQSNAQQGLTNYLSYALADMMTWQGCVALRSHPRAHTEVTHEHSRIGDIINDWRKRALGTQSLSLRSGPGLVDRLKIPWTYCLSPSLVPRPEDWKNHIGELDTMVFDCQRPSDYRCQQTSSASTSSTPTPDTCHPRNLPTSCRRARHLCTSGRQTFHLVARPC